MIVVNLFGGPGSGKSTTAAGLFYKLKLMGVRCELVTELAKELVWEERDGELEGEQPLFIFGEQYHRLSRLRHHRITYAITDSPLPLPIVYGGNTSLVPVIWDCWNEFDNVNYLIERTKPYDQVGRRENASEAKEIDHEILMLLRHNRVPFTSVPGDEKAVDRILALLLERAEA